MGIMWNQLQALPIDKGVVATLPNQPSQLDTLAGGLMQGLQAGAGMKTQALQQQNAQMEIDAKKAGIAQTQELAKIGQTTPNAADYNQKVIQFYINKGQPEAALTYKNALLTTESTTIGNLSKVQDMSQKEVESRFTNLKSIAGMASSMIDKTDQEAIIDYNSAAGDQIRALNPSAPKKGSDSNQILAFLHGSVDSAMDIKDRIAADPKLRAKLGFSAPKEGQPEIIKIQEERDNLQAAVDAGTATKADERRLTELQSTIDAKGRGTQQMTPGQKVTTDVTTARLTEDNKDVKVHRDNQAAAKTMLALGDNADSGSLASYKTSLSNIMNSAFGVKLDPKTPFNEAFTAAARQFQVNMQSLMKGQTSDRDMKLMAELGPQLTNTAPGRKLMANMIDYRSNGGIQQVAFENAWAEKHNGSLDGVDDAWDAFLETRNDIKVSKSGVEFTKYKRSDWAPFLSGDYKAPQSKTPSNTSQSQGKQWTFNPATGKLE